MAEARAEPAAHPAGRGQRGEPAGDAVDAQAAGLRAADGGDGRAPRSRRGSGTRSTWCCWTCGCRTATATRWPASCARARPPGRRAPIVAMTGSAESGERERCLAAGMDEFITKPVDLGLLCNVVERLTHGGPAARRRPRARGRRARRSREPVRRSRSWPTTRRCCARSRRPRRTSAGSRGRGRAGRLRGAAARPPAAPAHPGRAPGDDERAEAAEAEAGRRAGPGLDVEMLSSADVVPLAGGPGARRGREGAAAGARPRAARPELDGHPGAARLRCSARSSPRSGRGSSSWARR